MANWPPTSFQGWRNGLWWLSRRSWKWHLRRLYLSGARPSWPSRWRWPCPSWMISGRIISNNCHFTWTLKTVLVPSESETKLSSCSSRTGGNMIRGKQPISTDSVLSEPSKQWGKPPLRPKLPTLSYTLRYLATEICQQICNGSAKCETSFSN